MRFAFYTMKLEDSRVDPGCVAMERMEGMTNLASDVHCVSNRRPLRLPRGNLAQRDRVLGH